MNRTHNQIRAQDCAWLVANDVRHPALRGQGRALPDPENALIVPVNAGDHRLAVVCLHEEERVNKVVMVSKKEIKYRGAARSRGCNRRRDVFESIVLLVALLLLAGSLTVGLLVASAKEARTTLHPGQSDYNAPHGPFGQ